LLFAGACSQDVAPVFGEPGEDSRDLRRRLAFTEDDLRHTRAQGAMMIDFGEAEILEGQMAQASDRSVGREFAFADLLEKLADRFGVQRSTQQPALSIQPNSGLD
jgi:hypothetical protein